MRKIDWALVRFILINIVLLVLLIYFGYKSIKYMGIRENTWRIVLFAVILGGTIFIVGQVISYRVFKSQKEEMQNDLAVKLKAQRETHPSK